MNPLELERVYKTIYCKVCDDTGFIYGTPEYGRCDCEPSTFCEDDSTFSIVRLHDTYESHQRS